MIFVNVILTALLSKVSLADSTDFWDLLQQEAPVGVANFGKNLPDACDAAIQNPVNAIWSFCLQRPSLFPVQDLVDSVRKITTIQGICSVACRNALASFKANVVPACGEQALFLDGVTDASDFFSEVSSLVDVSCVQEVGVSDCYTKQLQFLAGKNLPIDPKFTTNIIVYRGQVTRPVFCDRCLFLQHKALTDKRRAFPPVYSSMVRAEIKQLNIFIEDYCPGFGIPEQGNVPGPIVIAPPVSGSVGDIPSIAGAIGAAVLSMAL
ncbi:hypothetical protein BC833DRAFT_654027 [Globomyces pollinis-pini]|nr:hypothetical protein BC833DRAFT_654027 [Globomyces pollinis-pini]